MRYVAMKQAPRSEEIWEWARGADHLARTVHEAEHKPIDTGLLDHTGTKLFRVEDRQPIGFVPLKAR